MKGRILHVLELLTAHPSGQPDDDPAKDFSNDKLKGSVQIPTQPRSHGPFHAFTQSYPTKAVSM